MGVVLQNESVVGGISSTLINKIGTAALETTAQDLSGAINELVNSGGGSDVSVTQKVSSGENIASITVDGTTTELYATNTTYSDFGGATSQAAGSHGLVPAPTTSDTSKYLKGDGTWATPTDTTYSDFTGATSSVAGVHGLVPAPATTDVGKFLSADGSWGDGGKPMVVLSCGNSTWAEFEAAYKSNVIVYCRASSGSDPSSGSQTRMAFMAYVNDATNPTEVEFQYYRSVKTKSDSAQGDQVFIYKLNKSTGWSYETRNTYSKIAAGTNMTSSYANGVLTLNATGGSGGTDENVAQTVTTTNSSNYELLFSGTADNTTRTEGAGKNSTLKCNPSTGNISVTSVSISGTVTNNTDAATKKYVDDSVGAAIAQVLNASY